MASGLGEGGGWRRLSAPSSRFGKLLWRLGVQDAAPPDQRARCAQHRIHHRLDDVRGAVVVGNGRYAAGDKQLAR